MPIHNPPEESHHEETRFTTAVCQSEQERMFRDGARRLLISALEAKVENYIEQRNDLRDAEGRQMVVRNGRLTV